ncbi:hypothetical protein [Streptomyces griseoaurantiacus]|uniref:hypothetical protein n=1 Tax=Streptomyces griseoaurantiacus TaxID=68213 RepID=UPI001FE4CD1F|nr:hypothetical protein [Streptomyces jietaisiensis]MCF0088813.1 hypothetical protein [Streptomyces sp. MH192]MCF0100734.1 hypothetical protein [Streptomyces sp. MH191]
MRTPPPEVEVAAPPPTHAAKPRPKPRATPPPAPPSAKPVSYPAYHPPAQRHRVRSSTSPVTFMLLITAPAVLAVAALRPR